MFRSSQLTHKLNCARTPFATSLTRITKYFLLRFLNSKSDKR